jgi:hypothetical protein
MAELYSVSLAIMDHDRNTTHMKLERDPGWGILTGLIDESDDLKKLVDSYSNCKAVRRADTEYQTYTAPDESFWTKFWEKGFDLVNEKALLIFRNPANGKMMKITLPGAKSSIFERVEGKKSLRVTQAVGSAFATKLSSITGVTWQFMKGYQIVTRQKGA